MQEILYIGPAPAEEDCAQLGQDPDFHQRNRLECAVFREQIRRHYGPEPEGARLVIKTEHHDFGAYREVVVGYRGSVESAADYAFRVEADDLGVLQQWDDQSRELLGLASIHPG